MVANVESYRTDLRTHLGSFPLFSGDNELSVTNISLALTEAIEEFAQHAPRITVEDEVGDSGNYYNVDTLLSNWDNDFSRITKIDYDASSRITSDESPDFLIKDDYQWMMYVDAGGTEYLYFPSNAPTSSVTMRITYTSFHTVNASSSSIPRKYDLAIKYLAMAKFCIEAELRATKTLNAPAGGSLASSVRTKAEEFGRLRMTFMNLFMQQLGGNETPPQATYREADLRFTQTGDQFLFHAGSRR